MKILCRLGLHFIFVSFLAAATLCTCLGASNMTGGCWKQERLALLKFKFTLTDDLEMLSSWVGNDCCMWERVICDDATRHVVSLHLRGNYKDNFDDGFYRYHEDYLRVDDAYLVGDKVDSSLAELTHLKHLDLSGNIFQGVRIPEFVGSLKLLRYLNLSNSGFHGIIPHHIGNLSSLKILDLSSYSLMPNDMAWVSGLSSLEHLDLHRIVLNEARNLDMVFYMIPSLIEVSLSECELSNSDLGPLLNFSIKRSNIKRLDLSLNNFKGPLHCIFQNMTSLEFLDLSHSDLSHPRNSANLLGIFPSLLELRLSECGLHNTHLSPPHLNFTPFSNIRYLDLSGNLIGHGFPPGLRNFSSLSALDLSSNYLNSSIPVMPKLLELDLSYNYFNNIEATGIWRQCHLKELRLLQYYGYDTIMDPPTEVSECSKYALERLNLGLSYNDTIPESLRRLTNLRALHISSVGLIRGPIPEALGQLEFLEVLDISSNQLTGPIPAFLGKLTELYPSDSKLINGSRPESLGKLTNLRALYLGVNSLTGPIPEALGRLRSLEVLDLSYNLLSGPIPTFFGQLTELYLSGNQLNGVIPESLGGITTLTKLFLESNQLTGPIPSSLGRLASLYSFSVSSNLLNGTIPVSIGQLTKLRFLDVSSNSLEGVVFKTHFANLSALKYLDLSTNRNLTFNVSREWLPPFQLTTVRLGSCKIGDEFPQWFQTQRKVESLVLSNASISGPLPIWLQKMHIIHVLDLSHNKLSGPLTNLPLGDPVARGYELRGKLLLQNNLFKGSIPRFLCRRTDLVILDLSRNRLTGEIPNCLGKLQELNMMLLNSNGLRGVIPSSLGQIFWLSWLKLNDNNLNGELPSDLASLKAPNVLDLGNNEFSGNIPKWIGENLTTLMVLRLHRNNFTGNIPRSLCNNPYLIILDFAHNSLTGPIPHCFGGFKGMVKPSGQAIHNGSSGDDSDVIQVMKGVALEYTTTLNLVLNMDLSSNKLGGEIPEELTTLSALVGLNLSHNHLSGGIPKSIGNMKSLNSLDFSGNELTGMIPPSMAALNFLSYLNLSHNFLSGQIPTGNQLQTLNDPSMYSDNRNLCGDPLPKSCSNHEDPTTITSKTKHEAVDEPMNLWFYLDIVSGFAAGFWGIIGVLVFKKQWRQNLFRFSEATIDKIHVAVVVRVSKIKRGREAM